MYSHFASTIKIIKFTKRKLLGILPLLSIIALEAILCLWWYKTHSTGLAAINLGTQAYTEQKILLDKAIEEHIRLKAFLLDLDSSNWHQEKIIRQDLQMGYPDEKVYLLK